MRSHRTSTQRIRAFVLGASAALLLFFGALGTAMASHYDLQDVELLPEALRDSLIAEGVENTEQLLMILLERQGRIEFVAKSGLDAAAVEKLAQTLELMQINGVGPKAATLLVLSGVNSVAELAQADVDSLLSAVIAINMEHAITGADPDRENIEDWVTRAAQVKYQLR